MTDQYLDSADIDVVNSRIVSLKESVSYVEEIVDKVVFDYSSYMDSVMRDIKRDIIDVDVPPPAMILEKYFLELSNCIYFMSDKIEKVGIYDSISKALYKEVYNKAYLDNQLKDSEKKNKTTIAENQAVAESSSKYESTVNDIYNKAYKILKNKIDSAQVMVSTLSKIISKRMEENKFNNVNNNNRQILNEEVSTEWKPF